jgi:hypothetical protein
VRKADTLERFHHFSPQYFKDDNAQIWNNWAVHSLFEHFGIEFVPNRWRCRYWKSFQVCEFDYVSERLTEQKKSQSQWNCFLFFSNPVSWFNLHFLSFFHNNYHVKLLRFSSISIHS